MIRGIDGLEIFRDRRDREEFISRISQLVKTTGTRILAWVLMGNHVHLLILSGPRGIPQFMRRLLTGHALYYNRKYRRKGHLFQNRYKSIVCEEDPYLLELIRYIHLNPLRAGVVESLEELERYPWSGHAVLVGELRNEWQEVGCVLGQFSSGKKRAKQAYRRFMEEGKNQGRRDDLTGGGLIRSLGGWSQVLSLRGKGEKTEYDSRILGSGSFVEEILREADQLIRRQIRVGKRKRSIDQVIEEICRKARIKEEEVRNGGQRREVSRIRAKIAYCLNRELGISMAEIARNVGVCTTAVIKAIKKTEPQNTKL